MGGRLGEGSLFLDDWSVDYTFFSQASWTEMRETHCSKVVKVVETTILVFLNGVTTASLRHSGKWFNGEWIIYQVINPRYLFYKLFIVIFRLCNLDFFQNESSTCSKYLMTVFIKI